MSSMNLIESNDDGVIIEISHGIKVKIISEDFNKNGSMEVEFDPDVITEDEATKITNDYFKALLNFIEDNDDKIITKEKLND